MDTDDRQCRQLIVVTVHAALIGNYIFIYVGIIKTRLA